LESVIVLLKFLLSSSTLDVKKQSELPEINKLVDLFSVANAWKCDHLHGKTHSNFECRSSNVSKRDQLGGFSITDYLLTTLAEPVDTPAQ
jgi:hypothetical protein